MDLVPLEDARDHILSCCTPLPVTTLPLAEAMGCVTAEDVVAAEPVPPFANTAMDGYAVRSADTANPPVRLTVTATLGAGTPPLERAIRPGEAVRIMTGAPLPPGADAIVMVERTTTVDGGRAVLVEASAEPGDHVRAAGDDLRPGQRVFAAGTVLGPAHLGVLASLGNENIGVFPRPRVGVISTGDELVDGATPLRPGLIRDANRPTLLALLANAGCQPLDLGIAPDNVAAIEGAVRRGISSCDALVMSGGVSVGDFDYVDAVLGRIGQLWSWQVAIKPAKPLTFALVDGRPVFGLPGNPVSAVVSFELFARPALRLVAGHRHPLAREVAAVVDAPLTRAPDGKLHLLRVKAEAADDGRLHVRPAGGQGSHQLLAMARANALALVPDGPGADVGDTVSVLLLDGRWPPAAADPTT